MMEEVNAYPITTWEIECQKFQEKFTAPDDCAAGAIFVAECTECGNKFPAHCI
jgi:hypothetical protein